MKNIKIFLAKMASITMRGNIEINIDILVKIVNSKDIFHILTEDTVYSVYLSALDLKDDEEKLLKLKHINTFMALETWSHEPAQTIESYLDYLIENDIWEKAIRIIKNLKFKKSELKCDYESFCKKYSLSEKN